MTDDRGSEPTTISIVGAGPGGLFLAILLRQHRPDWRLRVWERNAPGATFGFGVVFSDRTVELLEKADPTSMERIRADFQSWSDIEVATWNGVRRTGGHGFSAIARHRLLAILQERAAELGIDVEYESEAPDLDHLYETSALVVGADGINSQVRSHWADEFEPTIQMGRARFIWFATPRRYDALTFHFVDTKYGPFSTHAYPFSEELSTFIVEVDEDTWRRAELDRPGLPALGIGESDESAMRFCAEIFADSLHGQPLVSNASQWREFPTVRNGSWIAGDKVVLLGDAAHTAHFSVGSGTKMAMEDAAALAALLIDSGDPRTALQEYPQIRKPQVEKIQQLAEPSRGWWENFHLWVDRDLDSVAVNFLTRTGRETTSHIAKRDAAFASKVLRDDILDEGLELRDELVLRNRRAIQFSADASSMDSELAALRESDFIPGLVVLANASDVDLDRVRAMWSDSCPLVIARPQVTSNQSLCRIDVPMLDLGAHSANDDVATWMITPAAIDRHAEWDEFVNAAQQAEAAGTVLVIIEASDAAQDPRAVVTHACVVLRPRLSIPIAVAGCRSEVEALTHLNADRADIAIGTFSAGFTPEIHRRLALDSLLKPTGVVVVGASQDPSKAGNALLRNLETFPGLVQGLGRTGGTMHGRTVVDSPDALDDRIDLAIVAVPSAAVPAALDDLDRQGVRAAIICSGGFAETGSPEGVALQVDIDRIRKRNGMRILGPNTSGIALPPIGLHASFVPAVTELFPGSIAVVAQSGGVAHATALALQAEGIGIGAMIGTGNACDIDLAELTSALAGDGRYSAIALHLEGTNHGAQLLDAVRAASPTIPVIVLKSGVSDVDRLAVSHTGALTGDWVTARALLAEAGAVVVSTLGELVDAVAVLSLARLTADGTAAGAGVVTGQAGPGILLTDRMQVLGVSVPELEPSTEKKLCDLLPPLTHRQNPVDTGRPGDNFVDVITAVAADPGIAAIATYVLLEPDAVDLVAHLKEARDRCDIPIVASTNGITAEVLPVRDSLRSSGVPLLVNPERAATGVWALLADRKSGFLRSLREPQCPLPVAEVGELPSTEAEAKQVLQTAGFLVPQFRVCADREQASDAFDELRAHSGAVVAKISSSEISHKSAVGGVHVDITDVSGLQSALNLIDAVIEPSGRYLIEEQVAVGIDLFVAVRKDPSWGTIGLLGLGGTDVEERGQVELFALPTSATAIQERLSHLLQDPPDVAEQLLAAYQFLASALASWPDATSFEVNPMRIVGRDLVVLDALVAND